MTGVFTGNNPNNTSRNPGNGKNAQAPAAGDKQGAKGTKAAKAAAKDKDAKQQPAVLTQDGAPQLTAEQMVANSDANIERIKKELNLYAGAGEALGWLQQRDALSRPQRRRSPQPADRPRATRST